MALNLTAPFARGGAFPIDEALEKTKAEMLATNDNVMPDNYLCVCKDDHQLYLYSKSNDKDAQTGRYRLYSGSDVFEFTYGQTPYTDVLAAYNDKKVFVGILESERCFISDVHKVDNIIVMIRVLNTGSDRTEFSSLIVRSDDTWETSVTNAASTNYVDTADDDLKASIANVYGLLSSDIGGLSNLTTDDKNTLVGAINEVYEKSGEPFRVKNWAASSMNVQIPYCTEDIANTSIPKMDFAISDAEGADYQIVGMIAYEVKDASSQRINCWPVCQFTGNGQKTLTVRWACMGTTRKTASSINAWVLLKHR